MGLALISPPTTEPLSLDEARAWLKLDTHEDDGLVASLVNAARCAVEGWSGRVMVTQTWRWSLDRWPADPVLDCPLGPVSAVSAIQVADAAGTLAAVQPAAWTADLASEPARIALTTSVPAPRCPVGGIAIDLVCGYGAVAASVPEPLRMAVRLMLSFLYENRGDAEPAGLPVAAAALAEAYRPRRL